jgi:hypothetical protein
MSKEQVRTRRQVAYSKREREQVRLIYMGLGAVALLVPLVFGFGFLKSYVIEPGSAIATVNGSEITVRDYRNRVRYERFLLDEQLQRIIAEVTKLREEGNEQFIQFYEQMGSQIQQQRFLVGQQEFVERMIEDVLIAEEAKKQGVSVSDEEITEEINKFLAGRLGGLTESGASETVEARIEASATASIWTPTPTSTPLPTITPTKGITPTATPANTPTPGPTPTLNVIAVSELSNQYGNWLQALSDNANIDEATYRNIIKASVLRDKVQEIISDDTPTTGEQSHARHILVSFNQEQDNVSPDEKDGEKVELSEEEKAAAEAKAKQDAKKEAEKIVKLLEAGEDFAALAEQYSDDPGSRFNGGDLGFVTRGTFVEEVDDAVFTLPPGEIGEPVESQFGLHIIEVIERGERELSPSDYEQARQKRFTEWLETSRDEATVEDFWTEDKVPLEVRR